MGLLKITSETGMFHSACEMTIRGTSSWVGFQPATARSPISSGKVDRSNRSLLINHWITFELPDVRIRTGVSRAVTAYSSKNYVLGVCDCVSFTADIARNCGLTVTVVNMTPYGLIQALALYNTYADKG